MHISGVSDESKAYRLFDPISSKIIVSRDVVFEKGQEWSWDEAHKQTILADLEWELDEEASIEDEGNGEESKANEEFEDGSVENQCQAQNHK